MYLNKNLYYLRNLQNLGLDEFGKKISLSRGIYSTVEKNENPKIAIIKSIFEYYKNLDSSFTFDMLLFEDLEQSGYQFDDFKSSGTNSNNSIEEQLNKARIAYEKKLELDTLNRLLNNN